MTLPGWNAGCRLWHSHRRLQEGRMRRRDFVALCVGLGISSLAHAQQPRLHRVGVLLLGIADAESFKTELREGLRTSGFTEGQNVAFEIRSAEGKEALLPKLAAELAALKVDVIVALFTPCAIAAKQATREIPIVVVSGDPLRSGLVASLASPGGNISGVSLMAVELHGKCVELLRDMLPTVRRVAGLFNAEDPSWKAIEEQVILAGAATGVEIRPSIMVHSTSEIETAFARMQSDGAGALVVQGSLATKQVPDLALKHGLPATTVPRVFSEVGGLMSYGAAGPDTYRRSALFVTKILQGASPATMPVEQPAKFELVINLKTATTLGITVPQSLLARADEVIE